MNLLDLFSGIGGFSLGLERAGFRTAAFCEINPFCRRVLAHHWPGVPICHDVRNLDAAWLRAAGVDRIDAICGGFPCQDVSLAGKGAGLDGERSRLWREFARLVGELRPRFAFVENVGALRGRGLAAVLGDLASVGYDAEWHSIPAAAVGAPHLRDRVWIVGFAADSDGERCGQTQAVASVDRERGRPEVAGCPAADADQQQRRHGGPARQAGTWSESGREPVGLGPGFRRAAAADAAGAGQQELRGLQRRLARALAAAATPWERTTEPPLCRVDDELPAGVDRRRVARQDWQRLKALGNAVVPAIPEILGRAALEMLAGRSIPTAAGHAS